LQNKFASAIAVLNEQGYVTFEYVDRKINQTVEVEIPIDLVKIITSKVTSVIVRNVTI